MFTFGKQSTRKGFLFGAIAVLMLLLVLGAGYVTLNYMEVGGARWVIGGSLDVVSGGDLDIESGGSLKIGGTTVLTMLSDDTVYAIGGPNSIWAAANSLVAEGATADGNETMISFTDPTADRTVTVPDATGTLQLNNVAVLSAGDIAASSCYGTVLYGSDCDVNLPAVAANMDVTIYLDAAADVNINPDDSDQILVLTNGVGEAISSDATDGSFVRLRGIGSVNWICVGSSGTWSDIN